MTVRADAERLLGEIEMLAQISSAPPPAVTRVVFSEEDQRARAWLKERYVAAGLTVREDAVGNTFARWTGTDASLPPVATGSHVDAIPNAGKYDGVVGVLGALEAVRALKAAGFRSRRSIEIVQFTSEEPTRFGTGCLGSRLISGVLTAEKAAAMRDAEGTLEMWRSRAGFSGTLESVQMTPGAYAGFVELHIEQGPILEREGIAIGAVEKIAAPAAMRVAIEGEGGHAGAVLMPNRHDALLAGAEIALGVEKAANESGSMDAVGTTGVFQIEPGAINSVPCRARLEIDVRDTDLESRDRMLDSIRVAIAATGERRGVAVASELIHADPPAICDDGLVRAILAAAAELQLSAQRMISRAYHDSLFMATLCPTGMIFIPCRNGWSHRPDEYAEPEAIANGVNVLARVLERMSC